MCYSLEASVIAAAGLGLAGVGMVTRALHDDRRMIVFAAFPLVFSLHQLTEAAVWFTLHDWTAGQPVRILYTLIAFTVWPVLTPFAAAHAETDPERRKVWLLMCGIGVALAAYLIAKLAFSGGIDLSVYRHALAYDPLFDRPPIIAHILYVGLTVVPLLCSSRRAVQAFGVAVFATFVLALAANRPAWYSVWCMAAALFSLILAFGIERARTSDFDRLQMQR